MRLSIKINSELMGARDVHQYLNGLISLETVIGLMKDNEIKSFEKGNKRELVTKKKFVDDFIDAKFEVPYHNKKLGIDTMPRKLIADFNS